MKGYGRTEGTQLFVLYRSTMVPAGLHSLCSERTPVCVINHHTVRTPVTFLTCGPFVHLQHRRCLWICSFCGVARRQETREAFIYIVTIYIVHEHTRLCSCMRKCSVPKHSSLGRFEEEYRALAKESNNPNSINNAGLPILSLTEFFIVKSNVFLG